MQQGVVVKSTGSWYTVESENGDQVKCRIIGKFRLQGHKVTNPVAVGDQVLFELEDVEEVSGMIKEILPRKNYVVRQSPRKKHNVHLLASNVDQALLIITISNPKLKQGFIDRFLIMTEPYDIPVIIAFNKQDLYNDGDLGIYQYLKEIYEKIGHKTILVSAKESTGVDQLKHLLTSKTTLVAGQSGVGKSTLVNTLSDTLNIKTQDVSDYTGKGQHTTTFAEMFSLDKTTKIIDTPGIKTLAFNHLEVQDVSHNFREFFEASAECKFSNCTHRNEPKCAVKDQIESGEISELRYFNYIQILDEIEDQNYWERHKGV